MLFNLFISFSLYSFPYALHIIQFKRQNTGKKTIVVGKMAGSQMRYKIWKQNINVKVNSQGDREMPTVAFREKKPVLRQGEYNTYKKIHLRHM